MSLRLIAIVAVLIGAGTLALAFGPDTTAANHDLVVAPAADPLPSPVPEDKHAFIGTKKCKICHIDHFKGWDKTKMAKAFDILKPGQRVEAKKKFKLDPEKDYTTDKTCLPCHTTGFGAKKGYTLLGAKPEGDKKAEKAYKKAVKANKNLMGVSCEACHGAGEAYAKAFKEIQKSKRKYKPEELYKLGLRKVGKEMCVYCHNEKSPTYDKSKPFDFEKQKDIGRHPKIPLKQRDG